MCAIRLLRPEHVSGRRDQDPDDSVERVIWRHEGRCQHEDIAANATEKPARYGFGVNARAHLLFRRKRCLRHAVFDELHRAHQPLATNLTDARVISEA